MKKYLEKWYVWVCLLLALGLTYGFITAQVYAWHPTEFHFYANDEMFATAQEVLKTQSQNNYNDCIHGCAIYFKPGEDDFFNEPVMKCFDSCDEYYGKE